MTTTSRKEYPFIPSESYQLIEVGIVWYISLLIVSILKCRQTEIPPLPWYLLTLLHLCVYFLYTLALWLRLFPNGCVSRWMALKFVQFRE